jgi:hypothetical protein
VGTGSEKITLKQETLAGEAIEDERRIDRPGVRPPTSSLF